MNEIYERWVGAHAIVIVTPTHWYSTSSALKLMIDQLVCADGGNPDPTSTHGKKPAEAKALELKGWDYPKHLDGRVYGLVVHGDVAGIEGSRRALSDCSTGWPDRRRRPGPPRSLHRLLGAVRNQPRRSRQGLGDAGRDAQRRACGGAGDGGTAQGRAEGRAGGVAATASEMTYTLRPR